jgi:hypothetical protein
MLELILSYQPVFNLSLAPGYSKTVLKELGKEIILHQVTINGLVVMDPQLDGFSSATMNL